MKANSHLKELNEIDKVFNAGKYSEGFVKKTKAQDGIPLIGTGEHIWFADIPSSIGQAAIKRDAKSAWERFFKKNGGEPRTQKPSSTPSFYLSNISLKKKDINPVLLRVKLPKSLGEARIGDLPSYFEKSKLMGDYVLTY